MSHKMAYQILVKLYQTTYPNPQSSKTNPMLKQPEQQ